MTKKRKRVISMDPGKGKLPSEETFQSSSAQGLPGGPVVRTWCFHCLELGSISGQETVD